MAQYPKWLVNHHPVLVGTFLSKLIDLCRCECYANLSNNSQSLCENYKSKIKERFAKAWKKEHLLLKRRILLLIFEIHIEVSDWTVMLHRCWLLKNTLVLMIVNEWVHSITACFVQCQSKLKFKEEKNHSSHSVRHTFLY